MDGLYGWVSNNLDLNTKPHLLFILGEVQLMVNMVKTLDAFTGYQTRMVVVVDGLGLDFVC